MPGVFFYGNQVASLIYLIFCKITGKQEIELRFSTQSERDMTPNSNKVYCQSKLVYCQFRGQQGKLAYISYGPYA